MLSSVRVHTCDSTPTGRKCRAQSGRDAGHQNAFGPQMAECLVIAPSTARTHIQNIYSKLQVHSRDEAVRRARDLGLL
jgi:hypothetical protein